ncbi:MAG: hypothetical protein HZA52_15755 [Planctomycetes bacterium]|nr:hypothetical protein [Planctomycetota bacterium]
MREAPELDREAGAPMPNWASAFESAGLDAACVLTVACAFHLGLAAARRDWPTLGVGFIPTLLFALCARSALRHVRMRRARTWRAYRSIAAGLLVFGVLLVPPAIGTSVGGFAGVGLVLACAALLASALAFALLRGCAALG